MLAREGGGAEAGADFDALDRIDAHHGGGEVRIELAVDRRAEARGHARRDDFDHRTDGRSLLADGVEIGFPFLRRGRIGAPERVFRHVRPAPVRPVDDPVAHLDHGAADFYAAPENFARDRARSDPAGGFPRRRPAAAAIIADAVFPLRRVRAAG